MKKEEEEQSGFRVTDRRLFRETGELREETPPPEPEPARPTPPPIEDPPKRRPDPTREEPPKPTPEPPLEEPPPGAGEQIDFPSYLLGYYTQGLVFLGEVPNPVTNTIQQELEGARHTIDLLQMLQDKTRGNLSPEEDRLLESILYELRMKFMSKTKRIKL
jgi:hypothetical protein